jgi:hypothetical protein
MVRNIMGTNMATGTIHKTSYWFVRGLKEPSLYGYGLLGDWANKIQPKISLSDFWYILRSTSWYMIDLIWQCSDPTRDQLAHKLLVGQRATWPKLHMVWVCW